MKKISKFLIMIMLVLSLLVIFGCGDKASFKVSTNTIEVFVGESYALNIDKINFSDNTELLISSSDESIVREENENIIGVSVGEAVISISLKDDLSSSVDISVKVKMPEVKESFKVTEKVVSLVEGERYKLNIETYDLKEGTNVIVKSINENIVKIEGDTLCAVSEGTCKVEVYLSTDESSKVEVTCNVKKAEDELEEMITVNERSLQLFEGDIYELSIVTQNLKDDTNVIITSTDESVVKVVGNNLESQKEGTCKVEVYLSSDESKKIIIDVTVSAKPAKVLEVTETQIEIEEEESYKLNIHTENLDGDRVVIRSSDESITRVDNDMIIGVKSGSCLIDVYLASDENIKRSVSVTVNAKRPDEVIRVMQTEVVLEEEESLELSIVTEHLLDTTRVVVVSKNEELLSVNGNIITGLKEGTCNVEVYLSSNESDKIIVNVTIEKKKVLLISILVEDELGLFGEYPLAYQLENNKGDVDLVFEVEDDSVVKIDNNKLVALSLGETTLSIYDINDESTKVSKNIKVVVDPVVLMTKLNQDKVLVKDVTSYGENPREYTQKVYGSVSRYSFNELKIIEQIVPLSNTTYEGQKATPELLNTVEPLKLVRSGIKLDELKYIVYHDTGNINYGANALSHANYLVSAGNVSSRARSWHYTVDENVIYHHLPNDEVAWQGDSFDAYGRSIGIETCVDMGSDYYRTWQNMGKLVASLLYSNGLDINSVKQHYDMSGKNCPQTLRNNGLYSHAVSLIEGEYLVLKYLSDYNISFESLSPEYLDNTGKVIKQPLNTTRLGYKVQITGPNRYNKSIVLYSLIEGSVDKSPLPADEESVSIANAFDKKVSALPRVIKTTNEKTILALTDEYETLSDDVKRLVASSSVLRAKENTLLSLMDVKTNVMISEIYSGSSDYAYSYVELYNNTDLVVNLNDYRLVTLDGIDFKLKDLVINPHSFVLIAFGDYTNSKDKVLPDRVCLTNFSPNDFTIKLMKNDEVIDLVGVGNSDCEIESLLAKEKMSLSRKYLIDTNNNKRDFRNDSLSPQNFNNEIKNCEYDLDAFDFDYAVLKLYKEITSDDKDLINALKDKYDSLSSDSKEKIRKHNEYDKIIIEYESIKNPNIKVLYDLVNQIPKQIVDDYKLPTLDGLVYRYAEGEPDTYYDINTGEHKLRTFEAKYIKLIAVYKGVSREFVVNFGIASSDEKIVYNTGAKKPTSGTTSAGNGKYTDQLNSIGFGNVAIKIDGKVYFIGKDALIRLNDSKGTNLSRSDLRPLGGNDAFYNYGIVKGKAVQYAGSGALYYNESQSNLVFDLSDTYGRNNNGGYGYYKVIFSIDNDGDYSVLKVLPNSGTNTSSENYRVTLKPNEYLWCPHTYETNQDGGTWLINPGPQAFGGVLEAGKKLQIIHYK